MTKTKISDFEDIVMVQHIPSGRVFMQSGSKVKVLEYNGQGFDNHSVLDFPIPGYHIEGTYLTKRELIDVVKTWIDQI